MKKGLIVILALMLIFGLAISIKSESDKSRIVTIKINNTQIKAELAISSEEKRRGLSNRNSLKDNEGMLFIFSDKIIPSFWMKEMRFPLDIIWISDRKIVDINENLPMPGDEQILPRYSPKEQVNMVLEVNAGFVSSNKIKVGAEVKINDLYEI